MIIHVLAKTKSAKTGITKREDGTLEVRVHESPIDGKANDAITRELSSYLHVPLSRIHLVRGQHSKHKTFEMFL